MPRENVRFKATPQGRVQFTEAEEVARDAEDKAWADGSNDRLEAEHRATRNHLLNESDWTQIPDSALTDEAKALWVTYRTALRDLTAHEDWPELADADWPTTP
jgi:hypothetical protein